MRSRISFWIIGFIISSTVLAQEPALSEALFEIKRSGLHITPERHLLILNQDVSELEPLEFQLTYGQNLPQGAEIRSSLVGPGLAQAIPISLPAGQQTKLLLERDYFQEPGVYRLLETRVVVGDDVLAYSQPAQVEIEVVENFIVSEVEVRELTQDELLELGYVFDDDDYYSLKFSLGLLVEDREEKVSIDLLYPKKETEAFKPKIIRNPFKPYHVQLEIMRGPIGGAQAVCEKDESGTGSQHAALLLIPGNFSYLKSHFQVTAILFNKSNPLLNVSLQQLKANLKLPAPNNAGFPLSTRSALTVPMVNEGPDGQLNTADDSGFIAGGEKASASFILRGEQEGDYSVKIDMTGDMILPQGTEPFSAQGTGRIRVQNPFFQVTFEHPDVVVQGEPYTLGIRIFNSSETNLEGFQARLGDENGNRLVGCELASGQSPFVDLGSILPGEEGLAEYRLNPLVSGKVTASYLRTETGAGAALDLLVAVGETGERQTPIVFSFPDVWSSQVGDPLRIQLERYVKKSMDFALMPSANLPEGLSRLNPQAIRELNTVLVRTAQYGLFGDSDEFVLMSLFSNWNRSVGDYEPLDLVRRRFTRDFSQEMPLEAAFASMFESLNSDLSWQGHDLAYLMGYHFPRQTESFGVWVDANHPIEVTCQLPDWQRTGSEGSRDIAFSSVLEFSEHRYFVWISKLNELPLVDIKATQQTDINLTLVFPQNEGPGHWFFESDNMSIDRDLELRPNSQTGMVQCVKPNRPVQTESAETLTTKPFQLAYVRQLDPLLHAQADVYGRDFLFVFTAPIDMASLQPLVDHIKLNGQTSNSAELQSDGRSLIVASRMPVGPYKGAIPYEIRGIRSIFGQASDDLVGSISPSSWFTGVFVTGKVVDRFNSDLSGFRVSLLMVDTYDGKNKKILHSTQLDDQGLFNFDFVPFPPFEVQKNPEHEFSNFQIAVWRPGGRFKLGTFYPRGAGQEIFAEFSFSYEGAVVGQVLFENQPVPYTTVFGVNQDIEATGTITQTDAFGRFRLEPMEVGPVMVQAAHQHRIGTMSGYLTQANSPLELNIHIQRPTQSLTGTVNRIIGDTTVPLNECYVFFAKDGEVVNSMGTGNEQIPFNVYGKTGPDGVYFIEHVPVGLGDLTFYHPELGSQRVVYTMDASGINTYNFIFNEEPDSRDGVIEGRVYVDGVPASDFMVSSNDRMCRTLVDGSYRLEDLKTNTINTIRAKPLPGQPLGGNRPQSASITVFIPEDAPHLTHQDIHLTTPPKIAGQLLDENGEPIPFSPIYLPPYGLHEPVEPIAQTDIAGYWEGFPGKNGMLNVTGVRHPHLAYAQVFVDQNDVEGIVLQERPQADIQVQVYDYDGNAVVARVYLKSTIPAMKPAYLGLPLFADSQNELTNGQGECTVRNVNYGEIEIWAQSGLLGETRHYEGYLDANLTEPISLVFPRDTLSNLYGVVYDSNGLPSGEGVEVQAIGSGIRAVTTTNASGEYFFDSLVPVNQNANIAVTAVRTDQDRMYFDQATLRLKGDMHLRSDMYLKRRGNLKVRVVNQDDTPATAAVRCRFHDVNRLSGPIDDFVLQFEERVGQILEEDPYILFEDIPEGAVVVQAISGNGLTGVRTTDYSPNPITGNMELVIRLEATSEITGLFRDHGLQPIDSAEIQLLLDNRLLQQKVSDVDGAFFFGDLPMRMYELIGTDPATNLQGHSEVVTSAYQPLANVFLDLDPVVQLSGTLFDGSEVVSGATVELFFDKRSLITGTDLQGRYEFPNLGLGTYRIVATHPSTTRVAETRIDLEESGLFEQDLYFEQVFRLTVQVLNPDLTPAVNSLVQVTSSQGHVSGNSGFTDRDGRIEFKNLVARPYRISAQDDGTWGLVKGWITISQSGPPSHEKTLTYLGYGTVRGTVWDGAGHPVDTPVQVELLRRSPEGWQTQATIHTNALGSFEFGHLDLLIRYRLVALDVSGGDVGTDSFQLTEHGEVQSRDLNLVATTFISGTVFEPGGGQPSPGARIWLEEPLLRSALADQQGDFILYGVPAGTIQLFAESSTGSFITAVPPVVIENDTEGYPVPQIGFDIVLSGMSGLVGHVLYADGAPVQSGSVQVEASTFDLTRTALIQPDGSYLLNHLPLDTYSLSFHDDTLAKTELYGDVSVENGGQLSNLDLQFSASFNLSGRILASDGFTPVENGYIELIRQYGNQFFLAYHVTSNEDGSFTIPHVYPETYRMRVGNEQLTETIDQTFEMPNGDTQLDLRLIPALWLHGMVRDADGIIFSSGRVTLTQLDVTKSTHLNSHGEFHFDAVGEGALAVDVSLEGGWIQERHTMHMSGSSQTIQLTTSSGTRSVEGQAILQDATTQKPNVSITVNGVARTFIPDASGGFKIDRFPTGTPYQVRLRRGVLYRAWEFDALSSDELGTFYLDPTPPLVEFTQNQAVLDEFPIQLQVNLTEGDTDSEIDMGRTEILLNETVVTGAFSWVDGRGTWNLDVPHPAMLLGQNTLEVRASNSSNASTDMQFQFDLDLSDFAILVQLYDPSGIPTQGEARWEGVEFQTTDETGKLFLRNIPQGTHVVKAKSQNTGARLEILLDQNPVETLDINLYPYGTIEGQIRHVDPVIVSQAQLHFGNWLEPVEADGTYQFDFLPLEPGVVLVRSGNWLGYAELPTFDIAGQVVPGFDMDLRETGSIEGFVYDEDGVTPMSEAPVSISFPDLSTQLNREFHAQTTTDSVGHFLFEGVPGRTTCRIVADHPSGTRSASEEALIEDLGEVISMSLVLEQTGSMHGVVLNPNATPAQGLEVTVTGPKEQSAWTESDGSFDITGLPAGSYDLLVEDPTQFFFYETEIEQPAEVQDIGVLTLQTDEPPQLYVFEFPTTVDPLERPTFHYDIRDDRHLHEWTMTYTGQLEHQFSRELSGIKHIASPSAQIPLDQAPGTVNYNFVVRDHFGQTIEQAGVLEILLDTTEPIVNLTQPLADTALLEGQPLTLRAQATDPVGIDTITCETFLDGTPVDILVEQADIFGRADFAVNLPDISDPSTYEIRITASDRRGNENTTTGSWNLTPLNTEGSPNITWLAPSPGLMQPIWLEEGLQISIVADVEDPDGVSETRLLLDGEELEVRIWNQTEFRYEYLYTVPAEKRGAEQLTFAFEARDLGGQISWNQAQVVNIQGDVYQNLVLDPGETLPSNRLILLGDENRLSGTFELEELILCNGAVVSQAGMDPAQSYSTHLLVSGSIVIPWGSRIDVSGKGHPALPDFLGVGSGAGPSFVGLAASGTNRSETYGSPFIPKDAGSFFGGGALHTESAILWLDGRITANGRRPSGQEFFGSGGSLLISSGQIYGSGLVQANGFEGESNPSIPGGSGGRVALYSPDNQDVTIEALGGQGAGSGTVFRSIPDGNFPDGTKDILLFKNNSEMPETNRSFLLEYGSLVAGTDFTVHNEQVDGFSYQVITLASVAPAPHSLVGASLFDESGASLESRIHRHEINQLWSEPDTSFGNLEDGVQIQVAWDVDELRVSDQAHLVLEQPPHGVFVIQNGFVEAGSVETSDPVNLRDVPMTFIDRSVFIGNMAFPNLTSDSNADLGFNGHFHIEDLDHQVGVIEMDGTLFGTNLNIAPGASLQTPRREMASINLEYDQIIIDGAIHAQQAGIVPDPLTSSHGGVLAGESSYGSLYYPESFGQGNEFAGGRVRMAFQSCTLNGVVDASANYSYSYHKGSGGSILLEGQTLSGTGSLLANGHLSPHNYPGAGGRIAVRVDETSGYTGQSQAFGTRASGAGTIFFQTNDYPNGYLRVDNDGNVKTPVWSTPLPGLGNRISTIDTGGSSVVGNDFPDALVGLHVETNGSGPVKIASHTIDTLYPEEGQSFPSIAEGASFYGVHILDVLEVTGKASLYSPDVIRVVGELIVQDGASLDAGGLEIGGQSQTLSLSDGELELHRDMGFSEIYLDNFHLTLHAALDLSSVQLTNGARLTYFEPLTAQTVTVDASTLEAGVSREEGTGLFGEQVLLQNGAQWIVADLPSNSEAYPIIADISDQLVVDNSSMITTSGSTKVNRKVFQWPEGTNYTLTYSHGGTSASYYNDPTFGSFYKPNRFGGYYGGGLIQLQVTNLQVEGGIVANGSGYGAGGSIWLDVDTIAGAGEILAQPGDNSRGSGGRVAIHYGDLSQSNFQQVLSIEAVSDRYSGSAGTILLVAKTQNHRHLIIDQSSKFWGNFHQISRVYRRTGIQSLPEKVLGLDDQDTEPRRIYDPSWTDLPPDLAGQELVFEFESQIYRAVIESNEINSLTLDRDIPNPPVGTILNFELSLNQLTLRNGGQLTYPGTINLNSLEIEGEDLTGIYAEDVRGLPDTLLFSDVAFRLALTKSDWSQKALAFENSRFLCDFPIQLQSLDLVQSTVEHSAFDPYFANGSSPYQPLVDLTVETVSFDELSSIDVSERYMGNGSNPLNGHHGGLPLDQSNDTTYGSLFYPSGFGAGDWAGGRVKLEANTAQNLNIVAEGNVGSGGSIWVNVGALSGETILKASGLNQDTYHQGGGGRIALYYDQLNGNLNTQAYGSRSAGPIVIRDRTNQLYGTMRIENIYDHDSPYTPLPGFEALNLPTGFSQQQDAGSNTSTLTIPGLFITEHFKGYHLILNHDTDEPFLIRSSDTDSNGSSFTLEGILPNLIEGDHVQLAVLFDEIELCDTCTFEPSPVRVVLIDSVPPIIESVQVEPFWDGKLNANQEFSVSVNATDDKQMDRLEFHFNGLTQVVTGSGPYQVSFTAPEPSVETVFPILVTAHDLGGNLVDETLQLPVLPLDQEDPSVVITDPPADATIHAGSEFQITVEAQDNRLIRHLELEFDGVFYPIDYEDDQLLTTVQETFSLTAPSLDEDASMTLTARTEDVSGNRSFSDLQVSVIVVDIDGPVLELAEILPGQQLHVGDNFSLTVDATDETGVEQLEFQFDGQSVVDAEAPFQATFNTPASTTYSMLSVQVTAADPYGNTSQLDVDMGVFPTNYEIPELKIWNLDEGQQVQANEVLPLIIKTVQVESSFEEPESTWATERRAGSTSWDHWQIRSLEPNSGVQSYQVNDYANGQAALISPVFVAASDTTLEFWHRFSFSNYDGAQLFLKRLSNGEELDLGPFISMGGYNGTVSSNSFIGGQEAWRGYQDSQDRNVKVNLGNWAGERLQILWVYSGNYQTRAYYWSIDDVLISSPGASGVFSQLESHLNGQSHTLNTSQQVTELDILGNPNSGYAELGLVASGNLDGNPFEIQKWTSIDQLEDTTPPLVDLTEPQDNALLTAGSALTAHAEISERLPYIFNPSTAELWSVSMLDGSSNSTLAFDIQHSELQMNLNRWDNYFLGTWTSFAVPLPEKDPKISFDLNISNPNLERFGVQAQISVNEGLDWVDLGDLMLQTPYDSIVENGSGSLVSCWSITQDAHIDIDLEPYSGTNVQIRLEFFKSSSEAEVQASISDVVISGFKLDPTLPVQNVQFEFNGQANSAGSAPYQAHFTVPSPVQTMGFEIKVSAEDGQGLLSQDVHQVIVSGSGAQYHSNLQIDSDDMSYENLDLILQAGVHRIDGIHTFNSLLLESGAVLTQSPSMSTTQPARTELHVSGDVWIMQGAVVDVSGMGYPLDQTDPSAGLAHSWSYGGLGAGQTEGAYGSPFDPDHVGSATGGGLLRLHAANISLNGQIQSNGMADNGRYGSGGGVLLEASQSISGNGVIRTNGYQDQALPGGGGGRIALITSVLNFHGTLEAFGGSEASAGTVFLQSQDQSRLHVIGLDRDAPLTPLIHSDAQPIDLLLIENSQVELDHAVEGSHVHVVNARLVFQPASTLDLRDRLSLQDSRLEGHLLLSSNALNPTQHPAGSLELIGEFTTDNLLFNAQKLFLAGTLNAGNVTFEQGSGLYSLNDQPNQPVRLVASGNILLDDSSEIVANNGVGLNGNLYSHGGMGIYAGYDQSAPSGEIPGETAYGSFYWPESPGGAGGVIYLEGQSLAVDGLVKASGDEWGSTAHVGSSGGSILVVTDQFSGSGQIQANGIRQENSTYGEESGGSGGRIAIHVNGSNPPDFSGEINCKGAFLYAYEGSFGTVYWETVDYPNGHLVIGDYCGTFGRTVLPGIGERQALNDDLDLDATFNDPGQEFPADLAGRFISVGGQLIEILDSDADAIYGESPFPEIRVDDSYHGVHHLSKLTINCNLYSFDAIDADVIEHNGGLVESLGYEYPETITFSGSHGTLESWPNIQNLTLDGFHLTVNEPVDLQSLLLDSWGAGLTVNAVGTPDQPTLTAQNITVASGFIKADHIQVAQTFDVQSSSSMIMGATVFEAMDWPTGTPLEREDVGLSYGSLGSGRLEGEAYLQNPTFGSFKAPFYPGVGGSAIKIVAHTLNCNGDIQPTDFDDNYSTNPYLDRGGSVWIEVQNLSGSGSIEVNPSSDNSRNTNSHAPGRMAIYYSDMSGWTGDFKTHGREHYYDAYKSTGSGTLFLKSTSQAHGELILDNGFTDDEETLPGATPLVGLGLRTLGSNSTIESNTITDPDQIFPFGLVGLSLSYSNSQGDQEAEIIDQTAHSLTIDGDFGDLSTGATLEARVYLNRLVLKGGSQLHTPDELVITEELEFGTDVNEAVSTLWARKLVLPTDTVVLQNARGGLAIEQSTNLANLELEGGLFKVDLPLTLDSLSLTQDAVLSHRAPWNGPFQVYPNLPALDLDVQTLTIDSTSSIDVSSSGIREAENIDLMWGVSENFGTGHAGQTETMGLGYTYGSAFMPDTHGFGFEGESAGRVHIRSDQIDLQGDINASGTMGGSVWLDVSSISGTGLISADGGSKDGIFGSAGRIAIYFDDNQLSVEPSAVSAFNAASNTQIGAGTIYLFDRMNQEGTLILKNATDTPNILKTSIQGIGSYTINEQPSGNTITLPGASLRYSAKGFLVEIDATGERYRVVDHSETTLVLDRDLANLPPVPWQLNSVLPVQALVEEYASLELPMGDLLEISKLKAKNASVHGKLVFNQDMTELHDVELGLDQLEVRGNLYLLRSHLKIGTELQAKNLFLEKGSILSHPKRSLSEREPLILQVEDTLFVSPTSRIDLDGLGWTSGHDFLSHGGPAVNGNLAELYDSPVFPTLPGGGLAGGGSIWIRAKHMNLGGQLRANGNETSSGGAILIQVEKITGEGKINAIGGVMPGGFAGGGRIALHASHFSEFEGSMTTHETPPNTDFEAGTILLHSTQNTLPEKSGTDFVNLPDFRWFGSYDFQTQEHSPASGVLAEHHLISEQIESTSVNSVGSVWIVTSERNLLNLKGLFLHGADRVCQVTSVIQLEPRRFLLQFNGYIQPTNQPMSWVLPAIQSWPTGIRLIP